MTGPDHRSTKRKRDDKEPEQHVRGWRAYVHQRGQGQGSANFGSLAQEYRELEPEARQEYARIGKYATLGHKDGRSFPLTRRAALQKLRRAHGPGDTLQMVLAGDLTLLPSEGLFLLPPANKHPTLEQQNWLPHL